MIRRSASVSTTTVRRTGILAAGVLLAGVPLLTACGTPRQGAAAVIGDDQISVSSLQSRVNAVRDAQAEQPNGEQLIEQSGNISGSTLFTMVLAEVTDQALKDAGITITRRELQDFRDTSEKQAGGPEALESALLQQQGIAPRDIDAFFRTELGLRKLATANGTVLDSPEGQQKVGALLTKTSKAMDINVNPRYGKWNSDQLTIDPSAEPWLPKPTPGAV